MHTGESSKFNITEKIFESFGLNHVEGTSAKLEIEVAKIVVERQGIIFYLFFF